MLKNYFLLHTSFFLLVLSSVFSKNASKFTYEEFGFYLYFFLVLILLFIYAIVWQNILKIFTLTVALSNKSIIIVWSFFIGILIYDEKFSSYDILGMVLIVIGIYFISVKRR